MFGDVKYVVMGGSASRAGTIAALLLKELYPNTPLGLGVIPIGSAERYSIYKVGCVISVSHGMGAPSLSILLNELYKLLEHSGATGYCFLRVGTCGGIGINPGHIENIFLVSMRVHINI